MFAAFLKTLSHIERPPTLAVAVSGGADSMALLLLAHDWAKKKKGKVIALTVDHGLRKESSREARQVKAWCKTHDIAHHTLTWKHQQKTASQADARDARYRLLTDWCKKNAVLHLLTAHHQDDQAETLLMRLARGSFIDGLAAMPPASIRHGVRLLRPLLNIPKSALQDYLRAQKQDWIEDPSNVNPRYARTLLRKHLRENDSTRAAALAARFGAIRHAIDHAVAAEMARSVCIFPDGHATIEAYALTGDMGLRILSAAVTAVGRRDRPFRSEKLHRLQRELTGKNPPKRRSFGGVLIELRAKNAHFLLRPEPKAAAASAASARFLPPKPLAGHAFLGLNAPYA